MTVRTRLVLGFSYVLVVVIVALTIPLGIVLRDRARSELEALALTNAQTVAALLDASRLGGDAEQTRTLTRDAGRYANDVGGRVVVLDADGRVLADSDGADVGQSYVTPGRPEVASALASVPTSMLRTSRDEGGAIVVAAAPVIDQGSLVGAVRISRNVEQVQSNVARATAAIAVVALAGLIAGLAIAFALAGTFARPLARLARTARDLGDGDLSSRAGDVTGPNEIVELAGSFDDMADRLERSVQAQREFVANASHQLRTPLTGIKLRIEAARGSSSSEEREADLDAADAEVDRLSGTIDRLMILSRRVEEGRPSVADLADVVRRAEARWRDRAEGAGTTIRLDGAGGMALVDPIDLDQLLDVLIDNALTHGSGPVLIESGQRGYGLVLSVADRGRGIAPDERERVTERFFRGRDATGRGSGLGLSIAREIATNADGALRVSDASDGGTLIEIELRRAGDAAPDLAGS